MYEVIASEHRLGHCGQEGMGSKISGKIAGNFKSSADAERFIVELGDGRCDRCGGYGATIADPDYCYVAKSGAADLNVRRFIVKDILSFTLTNVLPESAVDAFADYWCDDDDIRKENLGEFIQRIAEYAIRTHQADPTDKIACKHSHLIIDEVTGAAACPDCDFCR